MRIKKTLVILRKYTQLMSDYVDKLIPEYQEVWSVDEMMLNVKNIEPMGKGYYSWMWSIVNPQTRFVIATEISKRRETRDAKKIFETGKQRVESNPPYVVTDSLNVYQASFRKEFDTRLAHAITASSGKDAISMANVGLRFRVNATKQLCIVSFIRYTTTKGFQMNRIK